MGSMSWIHWVIVLGIVALLFGGRGKLSSIMGDAAKGIKAFKDGLKDESNSEVADNKAKGALPRTEAEADRKKTADLDAALAEVGRRAEKLEHRASTMSARLDAAAAALRRAARRRAVAAEAGRRRAAALPQKDCGQEADAGPARGLRPDEALRYDAAEVSETKAAAREKTEFRYYCRDRVSARVELARGRPRVDAASGRDGGSADSDVLESRCRAGMSKYRKRTIDGIIAING